jgi:hypothetical protein
MADGERREDEHREGTGEGPGPQSHPDDAGPPLTEEDGTTSGASEGEHAHEPEPAAGGADAVPTREQGGL